jgi:hypothetical protein
MKLKTKYCSFLTAILISLSQISYAQDAVFLNKGQTSPFPGYLLPAGKVEQFQNDELQLSLLKTNNDSLTKSLTLEQQNSALKDQKVNLLLDQNNKLASAAYTERELNVWEKVAWFAGGVIATGLAVYGVHAIYGSH